MPATAHQGGGALEVATLGGGCFGALRRSTKRWRASSGSSRGTPEAMCQTLLTKRCARARPATPRWCSFLDPTVISTGSCSRSFSRSTIPRPSTGRARTSGTQYRSIILYHSPEQRETALEVIRELEEAGSGTTPSSPRWSRTPPFIRPKDYHVDYFARHPYQPYCRFVIAPKVQAFRQRHAGEAPRGG